MDDSGSKTTSNNGKHSACLVRVYIVWLLWKQYEGFFKNFSPWASKMARKAKALATKPDDPGSIPRAYTVDGEN